MIENFRHKGLARFFETGDKRGINAQHADRSRVLVTALSQAADALGVTRKTLLDLVNQHSRLSPEMAIRLEQMGWGSASHWLRMQPQRDLWEVRQRADSIHVRRRLFEAEVG